MLLINGIMNRKKIFFGTGIVAFSIGVIVSIFAEWSLIMRAGEDPGPTFIFFYVIGLWFILGFALIALAVILIVLSILEK